MPKIFISVLLICCMSSPAWGYDIYSWTDKYGGKVYSDNLMNAPETAAIVIPSGHINFIEPLMIYSGVIPYKKADSGAMIISGKVNGVDVDFVVDTGASLLVISPNTARLASINMANAKEVKVQTAAGPSSALSINIAQVSINGLVQHDVKGLVKSMQTSDNFGLLGMSFLSLYRMTVDSKRQLLIFDKR
ncbi:MAG: TIGR02281 family clan AA aspartic protease [Mariprofundales bacterium]